VQYLVFSSEDKVSSKLCGFEVHFSHISCSREGQLYRLEMLHSPDDIVTSTTLRFTGNSVKLNLINQTYCWKSY